MPFQGWQPGIIRVSGYFLDEKIVNYFEFKKLPVPIFGILKGLAVKDL